MQDDVKKLVEAFTDEAMTDESRARVLAYAGELRRRQNGLAVRELQEKRALDETACAQKLAI